MSDSNIHIAVLMMVKNEKKRLQVTLDSIRDFADSLVVFDTGSTDETIQILKDFSEESGIPLRLKEGEFVDFSTSRNVSLDFADTFEDITNLLLMDVNDELRGGDYLRNFAISQINTESTGYLVAQEWWSGQYDKYYNMRFVKAREGWRYRGSVHEWLKNTKAEEGKEPPVVRIPSDSVLYQDRTQDDDKSGKRFVRDKKLLLADHKTDPTEPRTLFYLAQTCSCLNDLEDCLYFYKLRINLEGFQEEKFHAYLRAGEVSEKLNHEWYDCMSWYMKAFEHSQRVEPLLKIAEYYRRKNNWLLAFTFVDLACKLKYPDQCILFVDKHSYDYKRWHIMGIVAYYAGFYKEGKIACEKAIECGLNSELDTNNLKFYQEKEKEQTDIQVKQQEEVISSLNKKEFINLHMQQLVAQNPTISKKQLETKSKMLWKLREKKK